METLKQNSGDCCISSFSQAKCISWHQTNSEGCSNQPSMKIKPLWQNCEKMMWNNWKLVTLINGQQLRRDKTGKQRLSWHRRILPFPWPERPQPDLLQLYHCPNKSMKLHGDMTKLWRTNVSAINMFISYGCTSAWLQPVRKTNYATKKWINLFIVSLFMLLTTVKLMTTLTL